jgi:hypothetical protein
VLLLLENSKVILPLRETLANQPRRKANDMDVTQMDLYDSFVLDGVRRTADGYLAAFAKVARTGIQEYKGAELGRPDLDKVRVYRPPEEVFHADALKSFTHRPVTLRHPSTPVTARNWKKYAGGQTGDQVVRDGEYIRVPMVMMDQALIDAYEKQGIKELSMGYSTDIQWRTGVTDSGEPYDAVQTAIRGNHLAVVPQARGGDQLRIGDSEDPHETGVYTMKLVIDGLPVQVADERDGAIIEKHIASLMTRLSDINDAFEDFKKKKKVEEKEVEDAKKISDAKDGEIAVLKKQVADAAVTPEKLDIMVKDRLAVIGAAKTLLGDKYVFDGKTLDVIRKEAVTVKLGDTVTSMSEGAIEGAFIALTKDAKPANAASQIGDALRQRPHSSVAVTDEREKAYDEMTKELANAWRTPAPAAH